jgi:hypothetical protein
VRGHITQLADPPKSTRIKRFLSGNFSPNRTAVIEFDTILLAEGRELPIQTTVGPPTERVTLEVAANPKAEKDEKGEKGEKDEKSEKGERDEKRERGSRSDAETASDWPGQAGRRPGGARREPEGA